MRLEKHWANAADTLVALVTTYGLRVIGAVVILVIGWIGARLMYGGIVRLCARSVRIDRTVTFFLANGARYSVLVFTFVAVLTSFGIATTSFVAVLGAGGLARGLSLQGQPFHLPARHNLVLFCPLPLPDRNGTGR